jgi:hypothetical protein
MQELKFCFKQLKRSQLGKSCNDLTFWDVVSADMEVLGSYTALRASEEQEEYTLISRLLGKDFLYRMRQILGREIYIDPSSIFDHADLKERFQALNNDQKKMIIETRKQRKFLKHYRQEFFKNTMRYIRVHDQESCLNILFSLTNSPKNLADLMQSLTLTKD